MKPFNLEAALAGELVALQDGTRAEVLYDLRNSQFSDAGAWPLAGIIEHGGTTVWTADGVALTRFTENTGIGARDIVCMWEEPKPKKYINGIEVPMHETTAPARGTRYYVVDFRVSSNRAPATWNDDQFDFNCLDVGLVFLTVEDAMATATAMKQFQLVKGGLNMNNERTPFDIEWAKRGGICAIDDEDIGKTTLYIFTQRGFIELNRRGRDFFWEMPTHGDLYNQAIDSDMRMATCAECEAAGLEYIEPPLKRVTELESAIRAFIDENKHLADGDNCTLAGLKQVIGGDDD